jgi:hypothetical protein
MKKIPAACILAALAMAACASTGPAKTPTAAPGVLTVTGIPAQYLNGVILASGSGENGEYFTCSSRVLQKITGTRVLITLYTEVSMIQKPFTGSGKYLVSIELHRAGDPDEAQLRYFYLKFLDGSAETGWAEGSAKPSSPR